VSVHHDLREQIAGALIEGAGGAEDTATGRMIVGNVDELTLHVVRAIADIEYRLGVVERGMTIMEFRQQLQEL
jgi:hypothetical protein